MRSVWRIPGHHGSGKSGGHLTTSARSVYRCLDMKILVIGGGGREHALVWKLRQSPSVEKIWCAPGNGGISDEAECVRVESKEGLKEVVALASLATLLGADLTVVGPELPLVSGIADEFAQRGLALFGPSKSAAQLEGSKIFAKEFLKRHNIPTARTYGIYDSADTASAALGNLSWPIVIKADGLCAGKGVLVARNQNEAASFVERAMRKREFGEGGAQILMEEALEGEELSLIVMTDGESTAPMAPARDHKRIFDGDQGPNTGGMGAYSTDELLPPEIAARINREIIQPSIRGMSSDGRPYRGFLYFGLMLTANGPKVLEFNCRMGDPEAQAIIYRMDFDLASVLASCAAGQLDPKAIRWNPTPSVCVVMASQGYPGDPQIGQSITGIKDAESLPDTKIFHAGTKKEGSIYYTTSGRVLGVTSSAPNLAAAVCNCYQAVHKIRFAGAQFRSDIAYRALVGQGSAAGD